MWTTKSASHLNLPDCSGVVPPPVTSATVTVNTCNTYNNCTTFNPIYVHSTLPSVPESATPTTASS
ncbi:MAG: hypothetical protein U0S36_02525 [Candidatus Nanopelagicales bacterium]